MGYTDQQNLEGVEIALDDNVTLVFLQASGNNPPMYYNSTEGIRMYQNGSTLDITANGKTITSVEFTFDNNMYYLIADSGELSSEAGVRTWTGSATAVKFTCNGTNKNSRAYVKTIKVTYEDAE